MTLTSVRLLFTTSTSPNKRPLKSGRHPTVNFSRKLVPFSPNRLSTQQRSIEWSASCWVISPIGARLDLLAEDGSIEQITVGNANPELVQRIKDTGFHRLVSFSPQSPVATVIATRE